MQFDREVDHEGASISNKDDRVAALPQGLSVDRVAEQSGVSKGAVISIIKDAREEKYPPLELKNKVDELHRMAVRLREDRLDISQAGVGLHKSHPISNSLGSA